MPKIYGWDDIGEVPKEPCVYDLFDGEERIRNGSSCNCNRRLQEHKRNIPEATSFSFKTVESPKLARIIEKNECKQDRPRLNKRCG